MQKEDVIMQILKEEIFKEFLFLMSSVYLDATLNVLWTCKSVFACFKNMSCVKFQTFPFFQVFT